MDEQVGQRGARSAAWRAAIAFGAVIAGGCGTSDDARDAAAGPADAAVDGDAGGDAGGARLVFSACPLVTQPGALPPGGSLPDAAAGDQRASPLRFLLAETYRLEGLGDATAECATVSLPAEWSEPDGDAIEVFVKRLPAKQPPATGQLWMLMGGPGNPGADLEKTAFVLADALPTLDVYLPDHRGTGRSSLVPCEEGMQLACAQALEHPDGLTVTDASRDLAWLIDAAAVPAQPTYVYGVSYGTAWALRYLQLEPAQAAAVVLDSVMPPEYDWADSNRNDDAMARRVLALCADDPSCADELGGDPETAAEQAEAAVEDGACALPQGIPSFSRYLGALVGAGPLTQRLIPASVHRVLRCEDADVEWLAQVWTHVQWGTTNGAIGRSRVLLWHIVMSEYWHPELSASEIIEEEQALLATEFGAGLVSLAAAWPRYAHDEHHGRWPEPQMPVLALQGGLDALTPYGDLVRTHFASGPHRYVEIPHAGHGALWSSRREASATACGVQIVQSFLADLERAPDTACVADVPSLDFAALESPWREYVGIDDLWGND